MIVGIDFGAPRRVREQRRKIIAIAAKALGRRSYRIGSTGMNERLLAHDVPGWSAQELVEELLVRPARVVGFDFPFCVPHALLRDPKFALEVGYREGAFIDWRAFNLWIAQNLPLNDPLDFAPFTPWRNHEDRARLWKKRATDVAAGGQPPLKDRFQSTFQMTLLGNALLSRLWESQIYRVLPFTGGGGEGEVIEIYPGATLRTLGLTNYKSRPENAVRRMIDACAAADVNLDVDHQLVARACQYNSGISTAPDHDLADAFVALCTAILHAEGMTRPLLPPASVLQDALLKECEGAIWVPAIPTGMSG